MATPIGKLNLTQAEIRALHAATQDDGNLQSVKDEASILLLLASSPKALEVCAARLGLPLHQIEATKRKYLANGLHAILHAERHETSPKEWEVFRKEILSVIENEPSRRLRWTPKDLAEILGISTDVVRYRCEHLGIDLQAHCDKIMEAKLKEVLAGAPPGERWTHATLAAALGLQPKNVFYWLKKLSLKIPQSTRDRRGELLAAIAATRKKYWNYSDIAKPLGVSNRHAIDLCKKQGIMPPPVPKDDIIHAALAKMPAAWNYSMLARESGFAHPTITDWCKKHGVSPNDSSRSEPTQTRRL